jgi:hypothetical protein
MQNRMNDSMIVRIRSNGAAGGWIAAILVSLVVALAVPAAAFAQGTTAGNIGGRVTDEQGQPLAGVAVQAVNLETGLQRTAVSGAEGLFIIRLLPPGEYRVRAERIGYEAGIVELVRLTVGQTATANVRLDPRAVQLDAISVVATREPINVREGGVSQYVSREEIESLPALGRDFTDFIALSGMVAPNPETTTGGQFSIGGARPSQTNLQIDGVDANNAFFGENRGGSRIPFAFSLESIREFQIITNGFDVEYGNYAGGVVNVVTRGGRNTFEGIAFANLRHDALTAADFMGEPPQDYSVMQFAGQLSGPIIRDRLFYFLSLDGQRRREPQQSISPDWFLAFTDADGNPAPDTERADALRRFYSVLENQYGIQNAANRYDRFQTSNDVLTGFGRIDWNVNDRHRLSARYNVSDFVNDYERASFRFGSTNAERFTGKSHSLVGELNSVLNPRTFNVARVQFAFEDRPRTGHELRPALRVNLGGGQEVGYGGPGLAFHNLMEERKVQFINNFTHVLGNHTLKLGANAIYTSVTNQFIRTGGGGEFRFNSVDDFENFRPASYSRVLRIDGEVPRANFDVVEAGLYVQNEWQMTRRLTATMGLRWDTQEFMDQPARVMDVERAFGFRTGVAPVDRNNLSPRLSLAYDVRGDGESVVRAGAGYFYGRIPYVLGGNVHQTELPVVQLTCTGNIGDAEPHAPPSPSGYRNWGLDGRDNPFSCLAEGGAVPVPEYAFWHPDFEYPETFKANVGYERTLGQRTRGSFDLVYTHSTKLYTVRNLNLRDPQFVLENEGGRMVFQPAEVFDPTSSAGTAHLRNTDFSNIFVNYNDGQAQALSATLEVSHRFGETGQVRGSYTFNRAFDNSSYSCCTAFAGWTSPRVGIYGPNDVGTIGDSDRAWGPSGYMRDHTFILSGQTSLPLGIRASVFWRANSGNPWSPEQNGDLNGDGISFNDRLFIFSPEDLPLATDDPQMAAEQRALYASYLDEYSCIGDYVGQLIPRNTCRNRWFNRLDVRLARQFSTLRGQRAELQVDLFNVLNGLNSDWGRYMYVPGPNRNLLLPQRYDAEGNQILYAVGRSFGQEAMLGFDLMLQFQAQVGLRYFF